MLEAVAAALGRRSALTYRLVIVEDDTNYRTSLATLFERTAGYATAASFRAAEPYLEALSGAAAAEWTCVLMDVELPGISGIEAVRRTRALRPELGLIVLTAFEDPSRILEAICAGADGYLTKKTRAHDLLAQIAAVAAGGASLTPGVARTVLDLLRGRRGAPVVGAGLTPREHDVLTGLVRGGSYKEIASDLGVGVETVRSHIKALYRKLQVHNVAEAVSKALCHAIVTV